VRQLADRGDWENALRVSTVLIDRDRLNPVAHFFHALILEGSGRGPASEQSLRQAIYLDRSFVLGHYHLGLLLQKKGDPNRARRSFRNVLTLLSPMKSSDTFDLADGITTGELTELTRMHLEVLSTAGEARG
jgi:chemotaxis protein methyltransferase CheR